MAQFFIEDSSFTPLKDKVVVITGGSSGIGLATAKLLLEVGAKVVVGDQNPSPIEHEHHSFLKTDVTSWDSLKALFAHAKDKHGRIDHTFSNAGIATRANYLVDKYDDAGSLLEPPTLNLDINLHGMINTSYLGMHYMRHQDPPGGSVVCTASASSFQRFAAWDYATAKHGVLGFMRGAVPNLKEEKAPIRMNCIGPSWTLTGLVPKVLCDYAGVESQEAEVVAKNVALLMADENRQGQFIYSVGGRYYEIEESKLMPAAMEITSVTAKTEQQGLEALNRLMPKLENTEVQAKAKAAVGTKEAAAVTAS